MRTLLLFRHGKSDWASDGGDDRSRPLSSRGKKAARAMGRFLARSDTPPDLALTSPAVRASETLRLAMAAGGWSCEIATREALYGGVPDLLGELRATDRDTGVLLVVGHEPTWSETAALLIGGGRLLMPTAAIARVELDIESWSEVAPGLGQLVFLVYPRLLKPSADPPD